MTSSTHYIAAAATQVPPALPGSPLLLLSAATRDTTPKASWKAGHPLPESKSFSATFQRPAAPGCLPAREPYPHPSLWGPCLSALLLLMLSSAPWTLTLGDRSRACEGTPPSCDSQRPSFIAHPPSATLISYGGRSVLIQRMGHAGEFDSPAFPGPILLLTPSVFCSQASQQVPLHSVFLK